MGPVVYILKEEAGRHYVGSTVDLEKRIRRHTDHTATITTRKGDWRLFAYTICPTLAEARTLERKIKSYKSGNGFKRILNGEVDGWVIMGKNKNCVDDY